MFTATIKNGKLVLEAPLNAEGKESTTGKTLILASSGGNKPAGVSIPNGPHKGTEITIGFNAYIKNPDHVAE